MNTIAVYMIPDKSFRELSKAYLEATMKMDLGNEVLFIFRKQVEIDLSRLNRFDYPGPLFMYRILNFHVQIQMFAP